MAASSGTAAKGALFVWNNYPVAEITNIAGPQSTGEKIDITNHDSPDNYREYIPGFLDGGSFDIEANFIPTDSIGQANLIADQQSRTSRTAQVCFGSSTFSFTGRVEMFRVQAPVGDKLSFTATISVSGKPTFITTASTGLTTPFFALRDNGENAVTPSPAAANATYEYAATLDAADTHIAVQPTATAGTIRVNGTAVSTGAWSDNIAVSSGGSKLVTVTVQESSKTVKVYRIWVTRPAS